MTSMTKLIHQKKEKKVRGIQNLKCIELGFKLNPHKLMFNENQYCILLNQLFHNHLPKAFNLPRNPKVEHKNVREMQIGSKLPLNPSNVTSLQFTESLFKSESWKYPQCPLTLQLRTILQ